MITTVNNLPVAGIVTHEYNEKNLKAITNHVDKTSMYLGSMKNQIPNLGNRDIYALSNRAETPFMLPALEAGTKQTLNSYHYKFVTPTTTEFNTTIISVDVAPGEKIGEIDTPFWLTASNAAMGMHTSRFTADLYGHFPLNVVDFRMKGEQVQYQVVFEGNVKGDKFIPQDVLRIGKKLTKLGNTRSKEFGQDYDGWAISGGNNREMIARISDYEINTHYNMTREACIIADTVKLDAEWLKNHLERVVEYIGIKKTANNNSSLNPAIKTLGDLADVMDGQDGRPAMNKSVIGFRFLSTMYDKISFGMLNKIASNMMVWDPGGLSGFDGLDKSYIHPGIWHQMNYSGIRHEFWVDSLTRDMIVSAISSFRAGKEVIPSFGNEPKYKLKGGQGAMHLLNKIFAKEALAIITAQVTAKELKQFSGDYQSGIKLYTPYYTGIKLAGLYDIEWEYDASMNGSIDDNEIDNPLINGFRLSSYVITIEDANLTSSNIKIFQAYEGDSDIRMHVVNGNMSHPFFQENMGTVPAHLASSNKSGFTAYFTSRPETAVMWDPTTMLKLSPINPYTGFSRF